MGSCHNTISMSIACSTCLECFTPSSNVSTTPCGHIFHTICINKWFQSNQNCPHCRNSFESNDIRKVYLSEAEPGDEQIDGSAQQLLQRVFAMACSEPNGEIAQMLIRNMCMECKNPVKESDKCHTLGSVYHLECQPYFIITNPDTNMVLSVDANPSHRGQYGEFPCIMMKLSNGNDKQLWYWESDLDGEFFIKSKGYPSKVLDVNGHDYNHRDWGQVSLYDVAHGGENQKWKITGSEIVSNWDNLRLDISKNKTLHSAQGINIGEQIPNVGCCDRNGQSNQQWQIVIPTGN